MQLTADVASLHFLKKLEITKDREVIESSDQLCNQKTLNKCLITNVMYYG